MLREKEARFKWKEDSVAYKEWTKAEFGLSVDDFQDYMVALVRVEKMYKENRRHGYLPVEENNMLLVCRVDSQERHVFLYDEYDAAKRLYYQKIWNTWAIVYICPKLCLL